MNILTDILSLFKRKQLVDQPTPDDLIVLGRHEEPDMLGVASPIPYKSVKLIKVKDLVTQNKCSYVNLNNGTGTKPVGIYASTTSNPCAVNLRSLCSVGNNMSVTQNGNEIEISTTGEPNYGINVGEGKSVYKDKTGEVLRFRTLKSNNGSIGVTELTNEINLTLEKVILSSPNGTIWELTIDNAGKLITTAIG